MGNSDSKEAEIATNKKKNSLEEISNHKEKGILRTSSEEKDKIIFPKKRILHLLEIFGKSNFSRTSTKNSDTSFMSNMILCHSDSDSSQQLVNGLQEKNVGSMKSTCNQEISPREKNKSTINLS